jgi:flagellar motor switch protein FliG
VSQPASLPATQGMPGGLMAVPDAGVAPIPGASRAAIALVALGAEHAAEVLKHMPEAQAEQLSAEMAMLGSVDEGLVDAICHDLVEATDSGANSSGGITYTRDVLERVVGSERAEALIKRFLSGEVGPFEFMRTMAPEEIATLLEGESEQSIALVIGRLSPSIAGRVLDQLDEALQADVAYRVARLSVIDAGLLKAIDAGLREKVLRGPQGGSETEQASGIEILASILQGSGRATERQVLGGLEDVDAELAAEVRARLFTFDDIIKLSDKDLQMVLREVEAPDLVVALRGVAQELLDRIVGNMSQRAGETLLEELEMAPPKKRAMVEEAQTKVVAAIRVLDEEGTISLPGGGEDDDDEALV